MGMVKNGSLFLRLAKESELDKIMEIYVGARSYDGCVWGDDYPNRECLLSDHKCGGLYVFELGGTLIGAISLVRDEDLDEFDCWDLSDENWTSFARVVIVREFLGKGYAKRMVLAALDVLKASGSRSVRILVSPSNPAAMSLYKGIGFEYHCIENLYETDFWLCEKILEDREIQ